MSPSPPAWLDVDLAALERNTREVCRLAGRRRVIAAIKANAYGFGAVRVAKALERSGIDALWTGNVEEAIAIRDAGVRSTIIMFGGYPPHLVGDLIDHDLVPTVFDAAGMAAAGSAAKRRGGPVPVFVKVDSGLRRLGVPVSAAADFVRAVAGDDRLAVAGVYTHLPFGDDGGRAWALARSAGFHDVLDELAADGIRPAVTQLWGSAGLLAALPDRTNTVCVGHLLYGLSPGAAGDPPAAGFTSLATAITATLIHVGHHVDGAASSPYVLGGATRTGVVALGTADGMRAGAVGETMHVLVRGRPARVLGVSLEHTVVALDDATEARVGDDVVMLGHSWDREVTLADWAKWFGCSELEVAVTLLGRLPKRYGAQSD
jgi:alanine racemase